MMLAGIAEGMACYRDARGKTRSAGTHSTTAKAEKAWQKAESDLAVGRLGDPKRSRQKFSVYVAETWFPNHEIEHSLSADDLFFEYVPPTEPKRRRRPEQLRRPGGELVSLPGRPATRARRRDCDGVKRCWPDWAFAVRWAGG